MDNEIRISSRMKYLLSACHYDQAEALLLVSYCISLIYILKKEKKTEEKISLRTILNLHQKLYDFILHCKTKVLSFQIIKFNYFILMRNRMIHCDISRSEFFKLSLFQNIIQITIRRNYIIN